MLKVLAENGVSVCHYFNPSDNAIQASCSRRALHRPVPGQDAILAHPLVQGVLCDKSHRQAMNGMVNGMVSDCALYCVVLFSGVGFCVERMKWTAVGRCA